MKTKAGIVGFRGYSGAELVHLLSHHPLTWSPCCWSIARPEAVALPIWSSRAACECGFRLEAIREHKMAVVGLATPPERFHGAFRADSQCRGQGCRFERRVPAGDCRKLQALV